MGWCLFFVWAWLYLVYRCLIYNNWGNGGGSSGHLFSQRSKIAGRGRRAGWKMKTGSCLATGRCVMCWGGLDVYGRRVGV